MRKKPITATIRELAVGEIASFPIERYGSVVNVVNRLRVELMRNGWKCSYCKDEQSFEVNVKRIS